MSKESKNSRDRKYRKEKKKAMSSFFAKAMTDFKNGVLKDETGALITDQSKAIAYAVKKSGFSSKDLKKAELRSKLQVCKGQLQYLLRKEIEKDNGLEKEILKLFRLVKNPTDTDIHGLAEKLGLDPAQVEDKIYAILKGFIVGGKSKGEEGDFDPEEVRLGMIVEAEHTEDPSLRRKIVNDHLTENPKYYTEGRDAGVFPELKKDMDSVAKKKVNVGGKKVTVHVKPGEGMHPKGVRQLQHVYESCRRGGGSKEKCAKQAWATAKRSGYKSQDEGKDFEELQDYLENQYLDGEKAK